jgi:uncharacterized protein YwgA
MDSNKDYKKPYDAALLAFSVLKRLGCGDVDIFDNRLKSQKVQYLAQVFGVSPKYTFGLYIRGPYSSALADDLYKFQANKEKPNLDNFLPDELEGRFSKLKQFIEGKDLRKLELITTLHLLLKVLLYTTDNAVKKLIELKSVTQAEVDYCFSELKKI